MSDKAKSPQGNVPLPSFGKRGFRGYFQDVSREMKRVVWPTRAETLRLTWLVLFVVVLFVVYLWSFGLLVELLVNKLMGTKV